MQGTTRVLAGMIWAGSLSVCAADNMRFYGTLIEPPPCTVNGGNLIDVDFGARLGVNRIDGSNYLQTVGYSVSCEPGVGNWLMSLTLIGSATVFDPAAVQTDIADLGIQILQNGQPFTLNQKLLVNPAALPVLQAVPVQKPGVQLSEGAFEATATLRADYQ